MFRRLMRFAAKTLLGLIGLVLAGYLVLVVANLEDSPPSEAARWAEEVRASRPAVADPDNAFVYRTGFSAPPDQDPQEAGRRRIDWAAGQAESPDRELRGEPPVSDADLRALRTTEVGAISQSCASGDAACLAALEAHPQVIARWLADEEWLLTRYRALIARPHWLEAAPFDDRVPLYGFWEVMEAQKLFLIDAWVQAATGDPAEVRSRLDADLRFWRMALAEADTLIDKMIAVAGVTRSLSLGNLVLRRAPRDRGPAVLPPEWLVPLRKTERDMARVFAGEWAYFDGHLDRKLRNGAFLAKADVDAEGFGQRLTTLAWPLLRPLILHQDSVNLQAERLREVALAMDVPYARLPETLDRMAAKDPGVSPNGPRNLLVRTALLFADPADYLSYAIRVTDLEGVRRAALATHALRAQGIPPDQAIEGLSRSDLRDPYTERPLFWDADAGTVVFRGLAQGDRARHALLY